MIEGYNCCRFITCTFMVLRAAIAMCAKKTFSTISLIFAHSESVVHCWHDILTLPSSCCSRNQGRSDQEGALQLQWAFSHYSLRFLFLAHRSGTWWRLSVFIDPLPQDSRFIAFLSSRTQNFSHQSVWTLKSVPVSETLRLHLSPSGTNNHATAKKHS